MPFRQKPKDGDEVKVGKGQGDPDSLRERLKEPKVLALDPICVQGSDYGRDVVVVGRVKKFYLGNVGW